MKRAKATEVSHAIELNLEKAERVKTQCTMRVFINAGPSVADGPARRCMSAEILATADH